jgi:hypothetical protein
MKRKDTPWSGLEKIPEEAVIQQLRKELSEANVKIGQLESYIQELEEKYPSKSSVEKYCRIRLNLLERAINNTDALRKGIIMQKNNLSERYNNLVKQCDWIRSGYFSFCLPKNKAERLMDILLYGIAYADEHSLPKSDLPALYKTIKSQLK